MCDLGGHASCGILIPSFVEGYAHESPNHDPGMKKDHTGRVKDAWFALSTRSVRQFPPCASQGDRRVGGAHLAEMGKSGLKRQDVFTNQILGTKL